MTRINPWLIAAFLHYFAAFAAWFFRTAEHAVLLGVAACFWMIGAVYIKIEDWQDSATPKKAESSAPESDDTPAP